MMSHPSLSLGKCASSKSIVQILGFQNTAAIMFWILHARNGTVRVCEEFILDGFKNTKVCLQKSPIWEYEY